MEKQKTEEIKKQNKYIKEIKNFTILIKISYFLLFENVLNKYYIIALVNTK